jgi:4-hydroxy-tetrahydrodipicolinate synthase
MKHTDLHNWSRRGFLATVAGTAFAAVAPAPRKPLRGIFVIVATPYTESKAVDYEDLAREVDWLDRCGAHGIVWPQRASEYDMLSVEERMRGFDAIADAAAKHNIKSAVVFGVQAADTDAALRYLEHADKCSPDALIAIPPEKASSLEDFRSYYSALAKATKRPIFIQTTGGADIEMPVSFIIELAREHPNLGYVKEELDPLMGRMKELSDNKPPLTRVFSGAAGKGMLPEMAMGADGTMPGASYTDVYVRIWEAWQAGDRAKAREMFARLSPLINLDGLAGQGYQYMLYRRGVFKTPRSRRQRPRLLPEVKAEIDAAFEELKPYLRV